MRFKFKAFGILKKLCCKKLLIGYLVDQEVLACRVLLEIRVFQEVLADIDRQYHSCRLAPLDVLYDCVTRCHE